MADPLTIATIFAGAGSAVNAAGNVAQGRSQNRRASRLENNALSQVQSGPSFLENLLRSQFNVGQDGLMQTLRAVPGGRTLEELSATGAPFDTSRLFSALQPVRDRQFRSGIADIRSTAPGLGQRFGSAMMANERQALLEHLQNISAQDAALQFQSHEAAQGRRLNAAGLGTGFTTTLIQLLGNAESGRRTSNLQAVATAGGVPMAGQQNYGQPLIDVGQLLLLRQLIQQPSTT